MRDVQSQCVFHIFLFFFFLALDYSRFNVEYLEILERLSKMTTICFEILQILPERNEITTFLELNTA